MSKIYFEMNGKERQLKHIGDTIEYAICMFGEGLSGTGDYNIPTKEVIELQSKISDQLFGVQSLINKLVEAVEEKEEKPQLIFHTVTGADEIRELSDCKVYLIQDIENREEGLHATEIVFHNEVTGMYISLMMDDDGDTSLSQWY